MQWPAFVVCTLVDGVILDQLPPLATRTLNFFDGLLIATFGNLFLLGVVAPFLAKRLMRRESLAVPAGATAPAAETDREVLQDRVAALLMAAGVAACLVSGLANRPVIVSETNETEEVGRQLTIFVNHSGNAELRRNRDAANTRNLGHGLFRVCIPKDDRRRFVCLYVDTGKDPVRVRRDTSASSNSELFGPSER